MDQSMIDKLIEALTEFIRGFFNKVSSKVEISQMPKYGDKGNWVTKLQTAINTYYPHYDLDVDGIFGGKTLAAVKGVQKELGLQGSGVIGEKTLAGLNLKIVDIGPDSGENRERVYAIASKEIGITEVPGRKHNPRVLEYHATTGKFSDDETSWCGSFVSWCLKQAGLSTIGAEGAGARNWLKYGVPTVNPKKGDIVVFWRVSISSWQGHVAFYSHEDKNYVYVLGGNQSGKVKISAYPKGQLLGYRTY